MSRASKISALLLLVLCILFYPVAFFLFGGYPLQKAIFMRAVANDEYQKAKIMLAYNPNFASSAHSGSETPLWFAVKNQKWGMVKLILDKGNDVTCSSDDMVLWDLYNSGKKDLILSCVQKGELDFYYVFSVAADFEDISIMEFCLVKVGDNINDPSHDKKSGWPFFKTALRIVARSRIKSMQFFLDKGFDLKKHGGDLLDMAISGKQIKMIYFLLERGCDFASLTKDHIARIGYFSDKNTIRYCMSKGFDVQKHKNVLLASAATRGSKEMVEFLLNEGADIDTNQSAPLRDALVCEAEAYTQKQKIEAAETVRLLIARGAKLDFLAPALRVQAATLLVSSRRAPFAFQAP